jgi:hypothetical protein
VSYYSVKSLKYFALPDHFLQAKLIYEERGEGVSSPRNPLSTATKFHETHTEHVIVSWHDAFGHRTTQKINDLGYL